jgi:hypothetical protein
MPIKDGKIINPPVETGFLIDTAIIDEEEKQV